MLLGSELLTAPGWRFVEGDLYGVAGRVREYDRDARLVREDQTGRLGIARQVNGRVLLACECMDWDTQRPLTGEPDPRVLIDMRHRDSHQIKSLRVWNRRHRDAREKRERADFMAMSESNGEHAERMVHTIGRKDRGIRNFASIPRGVT